MPTNLISLRIDDICAHHDRALFCIYAGADALTLAGANNIDLLREYVRVEQAIGHTFKPDLSLAEALERVERGEVPAGRCAGWAA